jgi:hypothetical protein
VIDVRFTPDAIKLLRSSEMTRWAITGHRRDPDQKEFDGELPHGSGPLLRQHTKVVLE